MKNLVEIAKDDVADKFDELESKVDEVASYLRVKYGINVQGGTFDKIFLRLIKTLDNLRQEVFRTIEAPKK